MRLLFHVLAVLFLALAIGVGAPGSVVAQTAPGATATSEIDYDAWESVAATAETMIAGGRASTAFFESRRSDLVGWRAQFLAADQANSTRVATIQSQIDALGPAPEEGEPEPETISNRRTALAQALSAAQVPSIQANEAFNRANGLIAEIDAILTERQTQALLELEPSPLNPANWATALSSLADVGVSLQRETAARIGDADVRSAMADNAPAIIVVLLIGLALIARGRVLVSRLGEKFLDADQRRGRTALGFVVSFGQLLLPVVGFSLLFLALDWSGLLTDDAADLAGALLALIFAVYTALWIGGRLFPNHEDRSAALEAALSLRRPLRRTILYIGLFVGLGTVAEVLADLDLVPPAARGVLMVPFHVGLGLMYLRLASLSRRIRADLVEEGQSNFAPGVIAIIGNALRVIGILGPLLGIIGYVNATEAVMIPTALTLFILGVLLALQSVIRDLYALIFRSTQQVASEALLPVLVNFALALVAIPVLAIVWGVRPERLGEVYVRILEGFALGDTRITPGIVLAVVLVFAVGLLVTRVVQGALKSTVLPRTNLDVGARNAVSSGVGYVGIALACLIAVTSAGIDLTALGFVVGALSVGIGFGLQNVISNFVSGIILLIERPITEGDWIEVNGNVGIVKDISVRSTTIETFDKTDVIVPNADFISGTVTNWTRGNTVGRVMLNVGVAYGTDTRRVAAILLEVAQSHADVSTFPEPGVDFMGFGADSMDFRVRVILRDINLFIKVQTELYHRIAERFAEEEIEIPFAQRDLWLRNPEVLAPRVTMPEPVPVDVPSSKNE